jgi:hypothetical protein
MATDVVGRPRARVAERGDSRNRRGVPLFIWEVGRGEPAYWAGDWTFPNGACGNGGWSSSSVLGLAGPGIEGDLARD